MKFAKFSLVSELPIQHHPNSAYVSQAVVIQIFGIELVGSAR